MNNFPPMFLREKELSEINEFLQNSSPKTPPVIIIKGRSGTGKTLMLKHILKTHQASDSVYLQCSQQKSLIPALIYGMASQFEQEKLKEMITPVMATALNGYVGSLLKPQDLMTGEFSKDHFSTDTTVISESLCLMLKKLCFPESMCLFLIDDVHFSDNHEIEILNQLFSFIMTESLSCKFVFSSTVNGVIDEKEWMKFGNFTDRIIHFRSFTQKETDSFIESILGYDFLLAFPDFRKHVWDVTAGNPFHITECFHELKNTGQLVKEDSYWTLKNFQYENLFPDLKSGLKSRLKTVKENTQEFKLCALIACFHDKIDFTNASQIMNTTSTAVGKTLKRLIQKNILNSDFQYIHPLMNAEFINRLSIKDKNTTNLLIINFLKNKPDFPDYVKAEYYEKIELSTDEIKQEALVCLKNAVNELYCRSSRIEDMRRWLILAESLETSKKEKIPYIFKIAYLEYTLGNTVEAVKLYERSLKTAKGIFRLELIDDYAPILKNKNEYEKAENLLSEGIEIAKKLKDDTRWSKLLLTLAKGLKKPLDDPFWKNADDQFKMMNSGRYVRINYARYLSVKIDQMIIANKWDGVKGLAEKALKMGEKEKCFHTCGTIHSNLFFMNLVKGNKEKMLHHVELARDYAIKYGHPHYITWTKGSTGQAMLGCGLQKEGVTWLEDAVKEFARMGKNISIQTPVLNLAETLIKLGQWSGAVNELEKYRPIFDRHQNHQTFSMFYMILGNALVLSGNRRSGIRTIKKGISIAEKMKLKFYSGQGYGYLGDAFYYKKRPVLKKALDHYLKADEDVYSNPALGSHGVHNAFQIYACNKKLKTGQEKRWLTEIEKRRKASDYEIGIEAEWAFINNQNPEVFEPLLSESLKIDEESTANVYFNRGLTRLKQAGKSYDHQAIEDILCGILVYIEWGNIIELNYKMKSLPKISFLPDKIKNEDLIVHLIISVLNEFRELKPFKHTRAEQTCHLLNTFLEKIQQGHFNSLSCFVTESNKSEILSELIRVFKNQNLNIHSPLYQYLNIRLQKQGINYSQLVNHLLNPQLIEINVLGKLKISLNNLLPDRNNWLLQVRRLLGYLICHKLHSEMGAQKSKIIADLWGDGNPEVLDKRFRQTLYRLRHLFINGESKSDNSITLVQTHPEHAYSIAGDSNISIDAVLFLEGYRAGRALESGQKQIKAVMEYERAVSYYNDSLLEDQDEIWSQNTRQDLEQHFFYMIDRLCEYYYEMKSPEMVHYYALKIRKIDPLEECGVFWQIKAWLHQRKQSTSIREYQNWAELFKKEMDAYPELTFEEIVSASSFRELWD